MKGSKQLLRGWQHGFTVIELMVATAVFGAVLLVITVGIMQLGRVYYKGITQSNTQNTARAVLDNISQAIQFTGGSITGTPANAPGTSQRFCVGDRQYSYTTGYQLSDSPASGKFQSYHVLVSRSVSGCQDLPAQNVRASGVSGRELMAPNMRLANLKVESIQGNAYKITVRVVYGNDDLLNNPSATNASCKNERVGMQFCAVSELSTVVTKRVE